MQVVYFTQKHPCDFDIENESSEYARSPLRCPFKDCCNPQELLKHGYYTRYLVTEEYNGRIRVRRYKCPKCGRTVSMLPSFCLPWYTFGLDIIVKAMRHAVSSGSVREAARKVVAATGNLTRRQISFYLSRLRRNRILIEYGLKQISPEAIIYDKSSGDIEWTQRLLFEIRPTLCPESNARFHKETGKSFMSTQKMIA